MGANSDWVAGLSPWPAEFGLDRMRTLLAALGNPERAFPAIHIVGTNGKTSTTLLTAALLRAEGLTTGAYISPHVTGFAERIQVDVGAADLESALARVRPQAEALNATQFEVLTAAALAEFAAREVEIAVVEAGLGGRHDATNVLDTRVVVLTNVSLEHTDVLGDTREAIAAEKLAVVVPGSVAIVGEPEWEELAREHQPARVDVVGSSNLALAIAAAEAFLGRPVDPHSAGLDSADSLQIPGRLEHRSEDPLEIWDGAHNLAGVGYLITRLPNPKLPARRYIVVASILRDKSATEMLAGLSAIGDAFVATASTNARALPAEELAQLAADYFDEVVAIADPAAALEHARTLASTDRGVLVTGSLYLLADLSENEEKPYDVSHP